MTRKEFISELQETLSGEVSNQVMIENINYYDTYIREQIETGSTEEEVLEMLGDPRLIAKTIIDTNGGDGDYYTDPGTQSMSSRYEQNEKEEEQPDPGFWIHSFDGNKWYVKVLAVLIPVLILIFIIAIALGFLKLVMYLAWPILIIGVCYYIYKLIRR